MYANHPLPVISTPYSQTGKTDEFTMNASHMALVHNVLIHGYNSIWLQAPRIKYADVPDFIGYCLSWYETVKGHHDSEEEVLFPLIEEATGVQGIMDDDKAEHDVFSQGLTEFKSYLDTCANNPTEFEGTHLVKIMDSFGHDLHSHLKKEPEKLASLSKYPIDMKAISEKTARHSMNRTSAVHVLPILWFNLDTDFEDGKWKNFPEVPGPIKWVMINVLGWWRSNLWRFGSCGADGKAVPLLALRDSY